jgi:hypothetical protein
MEIPEIKRKKEAQFQKSNDTTDREKDTTMVKPLKDAHINKIQYIE